VQVLSFKGAATATVKLKLWGMPACYRLIVASFVIPAFSVSKVVHHEYAFAFFATLVIP